MTLEGNLHTPKCRRAASLPALSISSSPVLDWSCYLPAATENIRWLPRKCHNLKRDREYRDKVRRGSCQMGRRPNPPSWWCVDHPVRVSLGVNALLIDEAERWTWNDLRESSRKLELCGDKSLLVNHQAGWLLCLISRRSREALLRCC